VTQERFRLVVSTILIVGVCVSATLIAIGLVGSFFVGWEGSLAGASPVDRPTSDFGVLPRGLTTLRPAALVQVGLLVLLLTPVARVAASVLAFLLERDWVYVAITALVLGVLLASMFVLR
jgi:uncharacterized membrane protein